MSLAEQLKQQTAAVRLKRKTFRGRKKLNDGERRQAVERFNTDPSFVSATKKLFDTKDPLWRAVTSVISRARAYWISMTVFYPAKGIRLMRRELMPQFEQRMNMFADELQHELNHLCAAYNQVKASAAEKLGQLFRPGDYPGVQDLREEFFIGWEYPNVDPPDYLRQLNPKLYEEQQRRVEAKFEEAIAAAEQALSAELRGLIDGLCDKLAPTSGKKKSLTPHAVEGFNEFIARFRQLNVRNDSELSAIVNQAEQLTKGLDPDQLKESGNGAKLFSAMTDVQQSLDKLIVDAPTRKITLEDQD